MLAVLTFVQAVFAIIFLQANLVVLGWQGYLGEPRRETYTPQSAQYIYIGRDWLLQARSSRTEPRSWLFPAQMPPFTLVWLVAL
jgi:hypothetical protein